MSSRPCDLATDTRWCPSRTKYSSPTLNSETGGIASPRRWAAAIRSQRERRRCEVGRKPRSKSAARSTVPDDVGELDDLQAAIDLARAPERVDDLLEGQDHGHVVRLAAQAAGDVGQQPRPPGAAEVVLCVLRGGAGAHPAPESTKRLRRRR